MDMTNISTVMSPEVLGQLTGMQVGVAVLEPGFLVGLIILLFLPLGRKSLILYSTKFLPKIYTGVVPISKQYSDFPVQERALLERKRLRFGNCNRLGNNLNHLRELGTLGKRHEGVKVNKEQIIPCVVV